MAAFVATAVLGITAIALSAIGGDALWDRIDQQDDVRRSAQAGGGEGEVPVPGAPAARLVVHESTERGVTGLTVLVPGADDAGGAVLFLPVGSMVEVPSFGLEPVGRAQELGGLPLLQQSVENMLGVRFRDVVVLDPDRAAALVEPFRSLAVDVPERVEDVDDRGRVQVLFEQGPVELGPDDVQLFLEAPGQTTDLGRLVRHQRFWSAWLTAVGAAGDEAGDGDGRGDGDVRFGGPGRSGLSGLVEVARVLAAGDVRFEVVPVSALSTGGDDDDLYQVDREALRALLDRVAPHARSAAGEGRIEVQLLNGAGVPGAAQLITPLLVSAGAEVKLVGNADRFDYDETQIVYYDPSQRVAAEAVRDALGVGQVVFSRQGLGVVDVTVVVGTDLIGGDAPDRETRE